MMLADDPGDGDEADTATWVVRPRRAKSGDRGNAPADGDETADDEHDRGQRPEPCPPEARIGSAAAGLLHRVADE